MTIASQIFAALVALLHVYFLVLEMFLWTTPFGQKTFARTPERQRQTKDLAASQGLYNGFLAAGLMWSLFAGAPIAMQLRLFFLGFIVIAGVFGALTANRKILFVQALPGLLAFVTSWLALGHA